jgi:hypothetical protein
MAGHCLMNGMSADGVVHDEPAYFASDEYRTAAWMFGAR